MNQNKMHTDTQQHVSIRNTLRTDLPSLQAVIDSSGLFPSSLLAGMMEGHFADPQSPAYWLTLELNEEPVALAYCGPEQLTSGTYNLFLIAVLGKHQGKGLGRRLIAYLENLLKVQGARLLIVETSGLPRFQLTRSFYHQCRYTEEARIRDFYTEGEDKIVFWKKL
jgi:ribosomal protein S18 acetylase RimI-like enzyme